MTPLQLHVRMSRPNRAASAGGRRTRSSTATNGTREAREAPPHAPLLLIPGFDENKYNDGGDEQACSNGNKEDRRRAREVLKQVEDPLAQQRRHVLQRGGGETLGGEILERRGERWSDGADVIEGWSERAYAGARRA
eukprot:CAMPEP_0182824466 /NCGR_PEP_ID=MMETSP0006_2-20121128/15307_1 /TAXON_ID=97485 /ORGANISM="Prymnesium parvum, Strain Texoma1" /LENGTH=136 /DNA_ID=CAMNT_0024951469 /DNA_START=201 /DNA_END=609 /DNA_ORIENTATION=-